MESGRKNERVTINKEFESFDQFISEYVTNVSRSGAFIRTSTPLPIGTEVDLRFTVVMDGIETIDGVGEVVRIETDPPGMGVVFKELSRYSAELIGLSGVPTAGDSLNAVADDLPESFFDSERIGQVLTNLIENAIKYVPSGGRIDVPPPPAQ